jgi:DNA-binding NarL/FixJ family response regulator
MVRRLLEAGASGYVLKSDFPRSLVDAVRSVSRDKRFLSSKVNEIVLNGFLGVPDGSDEIPAAECGSSANRPSVKRRLSVCSEQANRTKKLPPSSALP